MRGYRIDIEATVTIGNDEGFFLKGQIRSGKLALFCEHWRPVFMLDGNIEKVECLICSAFLKLPL